MSAGQRVLKRCPPPPVFAVWVCLGKQKEFHDLFVSRMKGRDTDGNLISDLEFTGNQPTFATEPFEHGLERQIQHTAGIWQQP